MTQIILEVPAEKVPIAQKALCNYAEVPNTAANAKKVISEILIGIIASQIRKETALENIPIT